MQRVSVQLGSRSYDVVIAPRLLESAGKQIAAALPHKPRCFVVTSGPVRKTWARVLTASLQAAGLEHVVVEMPDGERAKTLGVVEDLAAALVRKRADRQCAVLAFGGGVVGDVAGMLASVYMRGVDLVQIPTTLLAQVDAAIGGKNGVNLRAGKNLLGTFHQPRLVLADTTVLSTLPDREFRAGLFESLKCGVIRDASIFKLMDTQRERLLRRDPKVLADLITRSVRVKAAVVSADEREAGERRILNFGHTIGHALEAETGYRHFLHGEAVAWGMIAASKIAAAVKKTDSETARRIIDLILSYANLPKVETKAKRVVQRLSGDKKASDGVPAFVLPLGIGKVEVVSDIPVRVITQAVEELRNLSLA